LLGRSIQYLLQEPADHRFLLARLLRLEISAAVALVSAADAMAFAAFPSPIAVIAALIIPALIIAWTVIPRPIEPLAPAVPVTPAAFAPAASAGFD
jgi:hypothetical protein